jgi:NAD(P)-dependent dehydrogenase (short-subunit alcohol dehydrogenase family)
MTDPYVDPESFMTQSLASRIGLVTGASRGIGYATARALAKAGAHVVAVARTQAGLEELDDEIRSDGGSATLVPLDLTDFDGIARLGAALHERHGKLDVLIGNAGVAGPSSPLGHISLKQWQDVIAMNVTVNFQLIRCMEPLLKASDAGRAVFITSGAASLAPAYLGPYAASKAAPRNRIDTAPRQPVQSRPDPHANARDRFSRRRPADPGHARTGRGVDPADVRARVE